MDKTLGLLFMIGIGLALQRKVKSADQLQGLKNLILSVALPATIFVALLGVELSGSMLYFPMLALLFNGLLLVATFFGNKLFPDLNEARHRTAMMLLPSLAPGLSCFPFLAEFLGEESVALAALSDVGNKFFVLILLYLLAIHWHHKRYTAPDKDQKGKMKEIILALVGEPINVVIIVALVMLGLGYNLTTLPDTVSSTILRLSAIMAPLVLLFIGMAVKTNFREFGLILRMLFWRSGLTFLLSALFIVLVPGLSPALVLLAIVFPQSSCSFWPYAHMSVVNGKEEIDNPTFDINFGLSILALSLPFSTVLILGIFSFQEWAVNPVVLLLLGGAFLLMATISHLWKLSKKSTRKLFPSKSPA